MTLQSLGRTALGALLCISLNAPLVAQDTPAETPAAETPAADQAKPANPASYLIGLTIGEQMKNQGLTATDIDVASLAMAIADELAGKSPRLNQEELQAASKALQTMMQTRMQAKMEADQKQMQAAGTANKEKAELFLKENAKKEGVKQLAAGLQYKVEKAGTGASPTPQNIVRVHYTGKLISGEVFDSSVERGEPAEFPVGNLIPAWQTALPKMKVGDKWTLYAAPEMAYGLRGSPPKIGPNELLIFEMELLDIVK
ncbi:FKBP-type peptidyl-prolyl cis-trans isomerase [Planctomycetaceae bacterium SH139]